MTEDEEEIPGTYFRLLLDDCEKFVVLKVTKIQEKSQPDVKTQLSKACQL